MVRILAATETTILFNKIADTFFHSAKINVDNRLAVNSITHNVRFSIILSISLLVSINLNCSLLNSSGREDVGLRRVHLRHPVGPLPRHARLQHLQRRKPLHGSLVPHVCKDLHLYELVITFNGCRLGNKSDLEIASQVRRSGYRHISSTTLGSLTFDSFLGKTCF